MAASQPRTAAGAVRARWSTARGEDGERHSVDTDTDTQALWPPTTGAAVVEGANRGEAGRGLADGPGAGLAGRVLDGAGVGLELTDPRADAVDGTVEVAVAVGGAVERVSWAPQPASASSSTAMATVTPALRRVPTGSSSAGPGAAARVVGPEARRSLANGKERKERGQSEGRAEGKS